MFGKLIHDAQSAADSVLVKQANRAIVALPFLIAVGFATAAIGVKLVQEYGYFETCMLLAGGFAAIGLLAALIVRSKETSTVATEAKVAAGETKDTFAEAAGVAAAEAPAILATLLAAVGGPTTLLGVARIAGRNLPLLLLLAGIAALLWPQTVSQQNGAEAAAEGNDPVSVITGTTMSEAA